MCLFSLPQCFFSTYSVRELVYLKMYQRFETSPYQQSGHQQSLGNDLDEINSIYVQYGKLDVSLT